MAEVKPPGLTYRDAGVDIDAGDALVERIKGHVRRTMRPEVMTDLGGFAGMCALPTGYREPLLVSCTDGVGTKLKLAFMMGKHDTVGIDLVAMNVNDLVVSGAEPLFFLDYFASGALDVRVAESVIAGIADGCRQAGCALLGGETAEMPGFYVPGEYDLAGFCVGVVEKSRRIDGRAIEVGDTLLGLASSGFHSNGYSLVRRVFLDELGADLARPLEGLQRPLGEALLEPTRIYVRALRKQFGVVLQGSPLMAGDIFSNIVGVSGGTLEDAWAAARLAGLEEDIRSMPMGMHSAVGEGASTLSGGQRQRILLARALVGNPRILFLDEATSALDNQSQALVSESLLRLKSTRIIIAHRLSTVAQADQIVVLDQGQVVQIGTYEELMRKRDGLFARLARRQSLEGEEGEEPVE